MAFSSLPSASSSLARASFISSRAPSISPSAARDSISSSVPASSTLRVLSPLSKVPACSIAPPAPAITRVAAAAPMSPCTNGPPRRRLRAWPRSMTSGSASAPSTSGAGGICLSTSPFNSSSSSARSSWPSEGAFPFESSVRNASSSTKGWSCSARSSLSPWCFGAMMVSLPLPFCYEISAVRVGR